MIAMHATSDKQTYTADDILQLRYERLPVPKEQQVDPDLGAGGNWQQLRAGLKGSDG